MTTSISRPAATSDPRLRIQHTVLDDDHPCLVLHGDLDFGTAPVLDEHLRLAATHDARELCVDARGLEHCDSAGLSVLIGAARRAQRSAGRVVLRGVSGSLRRMLEITGIAALFRVADDPGSRRAP